MPGSMVSIKDSMMSKTQSAFKEFIGEWGKQYDNGMYIITNCGKSFKRSDGNMTT